MSQQLFYLAMAGLDAAMDRASAAANNIANRGTTAFKAQNPLFRAVPLYGQGQPDHVMVAAGADAADLRPGPVQQTGRSLDVAVKGPESRRRSNQHSRRLTQAQGDNISITGFTGTGTLSAGGTATVTLGTGVGDVAAATVQGLVSVQSNQAFALSVAASDIGLNTASSLSNLAGVNVSTISGPNAALNVVGFSLQQLENVGAQLGALQQRLQATASNLQTTNTNLSAARSVVQDASIPQVTTQLTQQEILQQAGVSALSQSSALQQSFLKLLQ